MVSVRATVMLLALITFYLLDSNTASAAYRRCCRRYKLKKIPFDGIKGYSVQTDKEYCPINAIIFYSADGASCANPAMKWVMDYIDLLRNKAQAVHIETSKVHK